MHGLRAFAAADPPPVLRAVWGRVSAIRLAPASGPLRFDSRYADPRGRLFYALLAALLN
jgi:hypothetical protein